MEKNLSVPDRTRGAWRGRVSGCLLGKPVEVLSFRKGRHGLESCLREAGALPLRDYVPLIEGTVVERLGGQCCRGHISRTEPDDDISYTVLALLLLEDKVTDLRTEDVARAWLRLLPAGTTWTAVRLGRELAGSGDAVDRLHAENEGLSPVHTVNNPALVVWALCSSEDDFSAAVGNPVSAVWDTDCNGATVGGLFGLTGTPIPESWTRPWQGRIGVSLAGYSELPLDELVDRMVAVSRTLQ